jgi:hypothetical protein
LLLLLPWPLAAQTSATDRQADPEALELGHDRVDWPMPETLLKDLRSADDQTRLKAFMLLGVKHAEIPVDADSKTGSPAKSMVKDIDESELRHDPLGTGDDLTRRFRGAPLVAFRKGSLRSGASVVLF